MQTTDSVCLRNIASSQLPTSIEAQSAEDFGITMSNATHQGAALRHGEDLYSKGKLDDAFSAFRKVVLLCSCNLNLRASSKKLGISSKDIPLPICHCKDYLSLPIDDPDSSFTDKEAIFKLATRPCSCGSGLQPCNNAAHIKALINIANVYAAQKSYSKAIQHASLAITLAPHLPEGYLRMVTIIRQGEVKCSPDAASRCNWIDTQASHTIRAYGDKNHELLKPIGRRIRRDIVRGVPAEIRHMILQQLSHLDICRAMRVSKAWKLMCRDRQLWKDLRLIRKWRHHAQRPPLRPGALNNIFKLSGNMATSLTIDGLWDFKFDDAKLRAMLKSLPELRTLSLSGRHAVAATDKNWALPKGVARFCDFWAAVWEGASPNLTTLHVSSFNSVDEPRDAPFVTPVLAKCRFKAALKELSLVKIEQSDAYLALHCALSSPMSINTLTIKDCGLFLDLAGTLPDQSCISNLTLDNIAMRSRQHNTRLVDWNCLQRLVLGKFITDGYKFPTSNILRSLELNCHGLNALNYLRWKEPTEKPFLPALEHFRCHFDIHNVYIQNFDDDMHMVDAQSSPYEVQPLLEILRPSIENHTLRYLDLTFMSEVKVAIDALYTSDQEGANKKEAIQILSCHDMTMPSINTGFGGNNNEFLDWVETFPNLTTVGAYPPKSENAHILILWLMKKRPDLKTIYTNVLRGVERDMVLDEARKRGIAIVHADRVPAPLLERKK